jgi:hypothetical protein
MPLPSSSLPTPSGTAEYLGPPPLNPGDDRDGFDTLVARLVAEVGPQGVIEEECLREAAEMMWDAARLRRLKAKLMTISAGKGVAEVLQAIGVEFTHARNLAPRWAARELLAVGEVDALLDAAGLDMHHVMAKTLEVKMDQAERYDRMAAGAAARRANALRELLLFRDPTFAVRLRRAFAAGDAIMEGEIARLPAPAGAPQAPALAAAQGAA